MQAPDVVQIPAPPAIPGQQVVVVRPGVDAPNAVYRAFSAQRQELSNQLDRLEDQRRGLANQLGEGTATGANKSGLEMRIGELDKRIADVDKQLAAADVSVASAAAVPGAVLPEPPHERSGPPDEVFALAGAFVVCCILPLSIAFARRIWKRGTVAVASFPAELGERLGRIDHAVDSIAIEVERIGEGQRFMTRVMNESGRALGGGTAIPMDVGAREMARGPRAGERDAL